MPGVQEIGISASALKEANMRRRKVSELHNLSDGKNSYDEFLHAVKQGTIPQHSPGGGPITISKEYDYAHQVRHNYGMWAAVYRDWTSVLAKWIGKRNTLEIMSGRGWLARALFMDGVNIKATDSLGKGWENTHRYGQGVFDVEAIDARSAIEKYDEWAEILICSWPPYNDMEIMRAMEAWDRPDGHVVLIGEGKYGATGPDCLWDIFLEDDDPRIDLYQWRGLHDRIHIGNILPFHLWPDNVLEEYAVFTGNKDLMKELGVEAIIMEEV